METKDNTDIVLGTDIDNNYRFNLSSCYAGSNHYIGLTFDVDSETKVVYVKTPALENTPVGYEVDSIEMAEDLDCRVDWTSSIREMLSDDVRSVSFEKPDRCVSRVIDAGVLEFGALTPNLAEYFLTGSDIKGLLRICRLHSIDGLESKVRWYGTFFPRSDVSRPYILSHESVSMGYSPQQGRSALPKRIKKQVPKEYAFWELEDDTIRQKTRELLVKCLDSGQIYLPLDDESNGTFKVYSIDGGYGLQLSHNGKFNFETENNITSIELNDGYMLKECDGSLFKEKDITDWGRCVVYQNMPNKKSVRFMGAKVKETWSLEQNSSGEWIVSVTTYQRRPERDLSNAQIDMIIHLSQERVSRHEIARQVGCTPKSAYNYMKILDLL